MECTIFNKPCDTASCEKNDNGMYPCEALPVSIINVVLDENFEFMCVACNHTDCAFNTCAQFETCFAEKYHDRICLGFCEEARNAIAAANIELAAIEPCPHATRDEDGNFTGPCALELCN